MTKHNVVPEKSLKEEVFDGGEKVEGETKKKESIRSTRHLLGQELLDNFRAAHPTLTKKDVTCAIGRAYFLSKKE